jgi:chloride channel 2
MVCYGVVCYGMVCYGMVWCGVVYYGIVWYETSVVWHRVLWYDMIWHNVVCYGMVWYVTVWCDILWYRVLWYMVWHDGVWYGNSMIYRVYKKKVIELQRAIVSKLLCVWTRFFHIRKDWVLAVEWICSSCQMDKKWAYTNPIKNVSQNRIFSGHTKIFPPSHSNIFADCEKDLPSLADICRVRD